MIILQSIQLPNLCTVHLKLTLYVNCTSVEKKKKKKVKLWRIFSRYLKGNCLICTNAKIPRTLASLRIRGGSNGTVLRTGLALPRSPKALGVAPWQPQGPLFPQQNLFLHQRRLLTLPSPLPISSVAKARAASNYQPCHLSGLIFLQRTSYSVYSVSYHMTRAWNTPWQGAQWFCNKT